MDPSSLAAESLQSSGGFASNRDAEPRSVPDPSDAAFREATGGRGGAVEGGEEQGGAAPSYATAGREELARDGAAKPHGKNLKGDEAFEKEGAGKKYRDGMEAAFKAEVGSADDPSRLAEAKFRRANEMGGGGPTMPAPGTEAGAFDALDQDRS